MDKRNIDLAAVAIIVILVVIAYFTIFKDGREKVAVLKADEARLAEALRSASDMNVELDRISEEIDHIQKNLEQFDRQLPEEKRIHDFLVEIDDLARKNSVSLKSISPGKIEKKPLYSRLPISIDGSSDFRNFYRFLFQLENIPRITMTDRLQITRILEGNMCDIKIDLAVFVGGK
jgi:Tfp pilus assembly protein PilO